jgi:hypothetical protein
MAPGTTGLPAVRDGSHGRRSHHTGNANRIANPDEEQLPTRLMKHAQTYEARLVACKADPSPVK